MAADRPSPITPEAWFRLLAALDGGAPQPLACRYAGISLAVWQAECQQIPEFAIEAGKVEASGAVAAWRFPAADVRQRVASGPGVRQALRRHQGARGGRAV